MLYRLLTILAIVIAGLMALAWPLSRVGFTASWDGDGFKRSLAIEDGLIRYRSELGPAPKPLDRDRYTIKAGGATAGARVFLPARKAFTATSSLLDIPIPGLFAVAGIAAGLLLCWPRWKARRRFKRGLCMACGYVRAASDSVCPECGKTVEDARAAAIPTGLLRGANLALIAAVAGVCLAVWQVARLDRASDAAGIAKGFDYSWYLDVCQPRLKGQVFIARPGTGPGDLTSLVQGAATEGSTIVLLPGHHDLFKEQWNRGGRDKAIKNLWLLGCGADTTSLSLQLTGVECVRFEGLTIECLDNPFVMAFDGGSMCLKDCRVQGYNSGAGSSNAVFGVGMALLVEGCQFEGKSGRASQLNMLGNAFDLREENRVFVRGTRFINNHTAFREATGVLDACSWTTDPGGRAYPPMGGRLHVRDTALPVVPGVPTAAIMVTVTQTTDELAALRQLAAGKGIGAWTDAAVRREAGIMRLARDHGLWKRLLLHPTPQVRALAADQAGTPAVAPTMSLEEAVAALGKSVIPREAALAMLSGGDVAKARLIQIQTSGTEQERAAAQGLLRLMEVNPTLPEFLRREAAGH